MDDIKFNKQHYYDETAYKTITKLHQDDLDRIKIALKAARRELHKHGFDTVNRIVLIDRRTGIVYK